MVLVGKLTGARGISGELFLQSFTQVAEHILCYQPLQDETGEREYVFKLVGTAGNNRLIVRLRGIQSREDAEKYRNKKIYIKRELLPKLNEKETYIYDLIGLCVMRKCRQVLGKIIAVEDYGAGAIIIWKRNNGDEEMTPFAEIFFGEINNTNRTIFYKGDH